MKKNQGKIPEIKDTGIELKRTKSRTLTMELENWVIDEIGGK